MLTTVIFIPVDHWDNGVNFYRDVMGFTFKNGDFYTPGTCTCACINLLIANEAERKESGLQNVRARFPIFRYFIETNFLSYCQEIFDKGGKFDCVLPVSQHEIF